MSVEANTNEFEAGKWIQSELESAATGILAWLDVVPEGEDLPAFRYQVQRRPGDVRVVAQDIVMANYLFLVVATVKGEVIEDGPRGLLHLSALITDTLHKANGETEKCTILASTRMQTYEMTEIVGADVYRHAGAMFEVLVRGKST